MRSRLDTAALRVLHVYKDYPPVRGGIEGHVRALCEGLAARGHDVTALVTAPRGPTRRSLEGGVNVVRCRRLFSLSSAPFSPSLVRELARARCDVTHLHIPYPPGEGAWLVAGRSPMVATYHSDIVRQKVLGRAWAPALRRVLTRADRILATSPTYARSSRLLATRPNVAVVPLGIEPSPFLQSRPDARARYGPGPTAVFVGRLRYYKGLGVLLEALARLDGVQLLVAGAGPMEAVWRGRAEHLGLGNRVRWLGEVPDAELPRVYAAGDVFVLPATARSEAFGIVQLEAMATGLPVVTTELGTGTSWVTEHGRTGLVVPPGDADALAAALRQLLGAPAQARAMGAAGRRRVLAHFTLDRVVAEVEAVYAAVRA